MGFSKDYENAEKEIKALPKKKRDRVRKAIKIHRKISELRWSLRELIAPLSDREAVLATRHAAMEHLLETRG